MKPLKHSVSFLSGELRQLNHLAKTTSAPVRMSFADRNDRIADSDFRFRPSAFETTSETNARSYAVSFDIRTPSNLTTSSCMPWLLSQIWMIGIIVKAATDTP